MIYTSKENSRIKDIKKLLVDKKYRDETGLFVVEGHHLVLEAYKSQKLETIYLLEGTDNPFDIESNYINKSILKYLTNTENPQNIIGVCKKNNNNKIGNRILVLDNVQDPGNLGTIIRSSVAFNIDTIILSDDTVDLYNPKVIRSSQGMLFKTNIIVTNIEETLNNLKKTHQLIGTRVDGGENLKSFTPKDKYVIIMGNEGNGVRSNILDMCDNFLFIPMNEKCESLNVGVAASIILYELSSKDV